MKDKQGRYGRIIDQLRELLKKTEDPVARMATVAAVLHHKMDRFFWTGFYIIRDGDLIVGPYQGPLACQVLERGKGVCWAAVLRNESVVVPDVHQFPGHIACDSRSKSEITVPVRNKKGEVLAVFDADSKDYNSFDETDRKALEIIGEMIYN